MPLALASCWVSLVRVLHEHGNEDPFWFCSPLAFLWPVLLFLQMLGVLSMVVPFPSCLPLCQTEAGLPMCLVGWGMLLGGRSASWNSPFGCQFSEG